MLWSTPITKRSWLFNNIIKNELPKENVNITNEPLTDTTGSTETKLQLFLPFSGKQGIQLLSKMKGKDALIHFDT